MKRLFILAIAAMSVALLVPVSRATAADLPVRPGPPAYYPVAAAYDWGGGYIGINGGYAFGKSQWSDALNPSHNNASDDFNVHGGLAGVTAGVSGQWSAFVLGVEGDFDWQGLKGTSSSAFCTSLFSSSAILSAPAGLGCKTQSNWLGTLRVRG